MARRNRLQRAFGSDPGGTQRSAYSGILSHTEYYTSAAGRAAPCDRAAGVLTSIVGRNGAQRLWKLAGEKIIGQIHQLHQTENAFFASVMNTVAAARAAREHAVEAKQMADVEKALAEEEARRAAGAAALKDAQDAQRAAEAQRNSEMQAKVDAAARREQEERDEEEKKRLQLERAILERMREADLAAAMHAEQQRLVAAEEAERRRERELAAAGQARAAALLAAKTKRRSLRPMPKKVPEYEVKRRKSKAEDDEPAESEVMKYASETMQVSGRSDYYEHVWCTRLQHTKAEIVSKDQLFDALRMVNSNLISPNQIKFCLMALDIVVDTSMGKTAFNYRMFCTIAALSERVTAMDDLLAGMADSLDFRDARALKLKIMKGRQLFYLAEGAKTHGTMSFDELEQICAAGNVDMTVADDLVQAVEDDGR